MNRGSALLISTGGTVIRAGGHVVRLSRGLLSVWCVDDKMDVESNDALHARGTAVQPPFLGGGERKTGWRTSR